MRALSQTVEKFYIFEAPVEMLPSGEPEARSFGRVQFQHTTWENGIQRQARTQTRCSGPCCSRCWGAASPGCSHLAWCSQNALVLLGTNRGWQKVSNIFWCVKCERTKLFDSVVFTRLNQRYCEAGKQMQPWKLITLKLNSWKISCRKVLVQSGIMGYFSAFVLQLQIDQMNVWREIDWVLSVLGGLN